MENQKSKRALSRCSCRLVAPTRLLVSMEGLRRQLDATPRREDGLSLAKTPGEAPLCGSWRQLRCGKSVVLLPLPFPALYLPRAQRASIRRHSDGIPTRTKVVQFLLCFKFWFWRKNKADVCCCTVSLKSMGMHKLCKPINVLHQNTLSATFVVKKVSNNNKICRMNPAGPNWQLAQGSNPIHSPSNEANFKLGNRPTLPASNCAIAFNQKIKGKYSVQTTIQWNHKNPLKKHT